MRQAHVNEGYELYQIITDFGDPLEIFREGIQNSFDADASNIYDYGENAADKHIYPARYRSNKKQDEE